MEGVCVCRLCVEEAKRYVYVYMIQMTFFALGIIVGVDLKSRNFGSV